MGFKKKILSWWQQFKEGRRLIRSIKSRLPRLQAKLEAARGSDEVKALEACLERVVRKIQTLETDPDVIAIQNELRALEALLHRQR